MNRQITMLSDHKSIHANLKALFIKINMLSTFSPSRHFHTCMTFICCGAQKQYFEECWYITIYGQKHETFNIIILCSTEERISLRFGTSVKECK